MNGVQDSLNGVKKLEEGLAFRGGVEGINQVSAAAKNLNFSEAQAGIAETTSRFSALQSIAFGALASIGGKITEIGSSMLSSFTVQPLIDGMKEYELQLNSVQTILANTAQKGETIQTVNAALDQLNTYADQTIYNFGEMTSNIGKFTAAGIGLDDSVASIKGLANWAAVAGANSEATSRAMYQLSQAMAAGTVKLQDWMSLENAGIATKQFQDQLIQTAKIHGKNVDEMIAKNGSFRLSLQEGWLDQEIMMETLKQMAGEYSDEQLLSMGYTEEQIAQRLDEMAARIDADYEGRDLLLVGVLKGAVYVMADLSRRLHRSAPMDWMAVSSYGSGTKSSGVVRILKDLDTDLTGRHVLIVEDIIDSGLTLSWLVGNLSSRGAASVEIAALLRKPEAAKVEVDVKYVGFDIPTEFVVGYGLDYAEEYRNLSFIGTLRPEVYGG